MISIYTPSSTRSNGVSTNPRHERSADGQPERESTEAKDRTPALVAEGWRELQVSNCQAGVKRDSIARAVSMSPSG